MDSQQNWSNTPPYSKAHSVSALSKRPVLPGSLLESVMYHQTAEDNQIFEGSLYHEI